MGVPGSHADTTEEFATHLRNAINKPGPHLIEIVVPVIV
jgi:thiamine pyrophosphate-dependent acetolactate synthase large subunit-like protein